MPSGSAGLPDESLKSRLAADRLEVRVVLRHFAAAVPHGDRLAEVFDRCGRLAGKAFAARGIEIEVRLVGARVDQLPAPRRRAGILPVVVEGARRVPPQLRRKPLNRIRQAKPWVTPGVVARLRRWR